jgi:dihydrofolate reductase
MTTDETSIRRPAGLLDEMQIHLVPLLLGGGVRLFEGLNPAGMELRRTRVIETPSATRLWFQVRAR